MRMTSLSLAAWLTFAMFGSAPTNYSGYIPSRRVAVEEGYEAQNDYMLDMEERIVGKVHELVGGQASEKTDGEKPSVEKP